MSILYAPPVKNSGSGLPSKKNSTGQRLTENFYRINSVNYTDFNTIMKKKCDKTANCENKTIAGQSIFFMLWNFTFTLPFSPKD